MDDEPTLFNVDTKLLNPDWIDPNTPLKIPVNPLHYKAHKLQLLLERLDKQATKNAAQFNSKNYMDILDEYTRLTDLINAGAKVDDKVLQQSGGVVEAGDSGAEGELGKTDAASLDSGISADNPFAR